MNWSYKMFQTNFLRKLGQGIPRFFYYTTLKSQFSLRKEKDPILTLTNTTFHFTILSLSNKALQ